MGVPTVHHLFLGMYILFIVNIVVGMVVVSLDMILTAFFVHQIERNEAKFIAHGKVRLGWFHSDSHRSFVLTAQLLICSVIVFLLFFGNEEELQDITVYSLLGMSLCHVAWMYFSACSPEFE